jgi:hypothetical protein
MINNAINKRYFFICLPLLPGDIFCSPYPDKGIPFLSAESISFILLDALDPKKLTKWCSKYTSLVTSGRGIRKATIGASLSQKVFWIQGQRKEQKQRPGWVPLASFGVTTIGVDRGLTVCIPSGCIQPWYPVFLRWHCNHSTKYALAWTNTNAITDLTFAQIEFLLKSPLAPLY